MSNCQIDYEVSCNEIQWEFGLDTTNKIDIVKIRDSIIFNVINSIDMASKIIQSM